MAVIFLNGGSLAERTLMHVISADSNAAVSSSERSPCAVIHTTDDWLAKLQQPGEGNDGVCIFHEQTESSGPTGEKATHVAISAVCTLKCDETVEFH